MMSRGIDREVHSVSDGRKEIRIFKTANQMVDHAIDLWSEISEAQLEKKGHFSAALSGGTTPVPLYEKLAALKAAPWEKTHIFIVDERFVPYESDQNNYHMINRTLLHRVGIPRGNIHPILTTGTSARASAERYEQDMISYCKKVRTKLPRFGLILLGMGGDGHTASLFPGTGALKETQRLSVSVTLPDRAERITITFPVINNSENIIFMVTGINKAPVVQEVIENEKCSLPAAMVKPEEGKLIFLLDEAAGSLLS